MKYQKAEIFYHVNSNEKQKIIINPDNLKENIIFPELDKKTILIKNLRDSKGQLNFRDDSLEFFNYPSRIKNFDDKISLDQYDIELTTFINKNLNVSEIIIFDHTIRTEEQSSRPPARHAHIDYTEKSAQETVRRYVQSSYQQEWLQSHFAIVNIWRPIINIVESAPLGFILPKSVAKKDLIDIDLQYKDRLGEVTGTVFNECHQWVYLSEMRPDEIVLFNMYDSFKKPPMVHSAFDLENTKPGAVRKSIESRVLIKF